MRFVRHPGKVEWGIGVVAGEDATDLDILFEGVGYRKIAEAFRGLSEVAELYLFALNESALQRYRDYHKDIDEEFDAPSTGRRRDSGAGKTPGASKARGRLTRKPT